MVTSKSLSDGVLIPLARVMGAIGVLGRQLLVGVGCWVLCLSEGFDRRSWYQDALANPAGGKFPA